METVLIICAVVCFVDTVLVFFAICGGAMNNEEIKTLRIKARLQKNRIEFLEKYKAHVSELEKVKDEIREEFYVTDFFTKRQILKATAHEFEKVIKVSPSLPEMMTRLSKLIADAKYKQPSEYKLILIRCYTSKEMVREHKSELARFRGEESECNNTEEDVENLAKKIVGKNII